MDRGGRAWGDGREAWNRLRSWLVHPAARAAADALDALSDIGRLRQLLDQVELAAVRAARRNGSSWAEIATRLGVSRQSAWERWRELDEAPPASTSEATFEEETVRQIQAAAAAEELVGRAAGMLRRRSNVTVPDVVGLSFDDARSLLLQRRLVAVGPDPDGPSISASAGPTGMVTDQSPESGARVPAGSAVTLWLGRSSRTAPADS